MKNVEQDVENFTIIERVYNFLGGEKQMKLPPYL